MKTPLEVAYSPSSMIDRIEPFIERYYAESEEVLADRPPTVIEYGGNERQRVDYFPVESSPLVHVFIHGGYWQELDRRSASFPAALFTEAGHSYASVGYRLAPEVTLETIVADVRAAIVALYGQCRSDGIDEPRFVVSGSSAGAHLAAMAALAKWEANDARLEGVFVGVVLLSGVYDLRPLVTTYINQPLQLDAGRAAALSPLLADLRDWPAVPTLVAVGAIETAAFKRQSADFVDALRRVGKPAELVEVAGRNHFDIVHDLADPSTPLGEAVSMLTRRPG